MTGCERILARLEEGPATAAELYATTYTVVHSRIADLRKRGFAITCEKVDGEGAASYVYTLCSEEPSVSPLATAGSATEPDAAGSTPVSPAQLTLEAA